MNAKWSLKYSRLAWLYLDQLCAVMYANYERRAGNTQLTQHHHHHHHHPLTPSQAELGMQTQVQSGLITLLPWK